MKKTDVIQNKNKMITFLLAFFLGFVGVHKFYLRENKIGFLYLIFSWTGLTGWLGWFDAFRILFMSQNIFDMKYNGDSVVGISYSKPIFSFIQKNDNCVLSGKCLIDGKTYFVEGMKNNFIVKNDLYEFKIVNGEIVAYKNKRTDKEFIDYLVGGTV